MIQLPIPFGEGHAVLVEGRIGFGVVLHIQDVAGIGGQRMVGERLVEKFVARAHDAGEVAVVALAAALVVFGAAGHAVIGAVAQFVLAPPAAGVDVPDEGAAGQQLIVDDAVQAIPIDRAESGVAAEAAGGCAEHAAAGQVLMGPSDDGGHATGELFVAGRRFAGAGQPAPAFVPGDVGRGDHVAVRPGRHGRAHLGLRLQQVGDMGQVAGAAAAGLQENGLVARAAIGAERQMAAHVVHHEGDLLLRRTGLADVHDGLAGSRIMGRGGALAPVCASLLAGVAHPVVAGFVGLATRNRKGRLRVTGFGNFAHLHQPGQFPGGRLGFDAAHWRIACGTRRCRCLRHGVRPAGRWLSPARRQQEDPQSSGKSLSHACTAPRHRFP